MARTILITRHGNREDFVDASWPDRAARPDDPDLSPDGRRQAGELADRLAGEPIDHLFSSPYLRAIHTAQLCAAGKNLPIKIEDGLGEFLEPAKFTAQPVLLSRKELARRFSIDPSYRSIYEPEFPESKPVLLARCRTVIETILARTSGNLLLVGHGASCKALIYTLLGRQLKLKVPLCSLTQLVEENGAWHLRLNGDTSFLSGGAVYGERF
ncbi:MAG: histidine phosphatase family protein [Deltaproteobacteria bacterium]|jgi:broad specificity phosphatase PhoE